MIHTLKISIIIFAMVVLSVFPVLASVPSFSGKISVDNVYEFMFTDYDRACSIMELLRKQRGTPEYRLDVTEGDLYFNNGKYYKALRLYLKALDAPEVKKNDTLCMEQMHRLVSVYDCINNDVGKINMVRRLLAKARSAGHEGMESVALFNMGKSVYLQEDKETGYRLMLDAVRLMEKSDYRLKYDNLRYDYNTLIMYYIRDGKNADAYKMLVKAEKIWNADKPGQHNVKGLPQREQKILLAYRTVILHNLGRKGEAKEAFSRFQKVQPDNHTHDYIVMPYLFAKGRYDDVIRMNREREARMAAAGDTVNYHMLTIKRSLGNSYYMKGMTDSAAMYYKELAELIEALKKEEQHSTALELATIYETHEKDRQLALQSETLKIRTVFIIFLALLSVVSGVFSWHVFRRGREIRRKNSTLAGDMAELLEYKQRFYDKRQENIVLRETIENMSRSVDAKLLPDGYAENTVDVKTRENTVWTMADKTEKAAAELWDRIENDIITEKLYLDPDFSRDTVLSRYGIPKNQFASFFRKYADTTFSKYINGLRLDRVVKLMNSRDNYSLEGIARECGIPSSTTFYRLFSERYGLTPNEYRKLHSRTEEGTLINEHK